MTLSLQALRVFLAILENGSLSAAGRQLGMSQPARCIAVAEGAGIGVVPTRTLSSEHPLKPLHGQGLSFVRPFVLVVERNRNLSPSAEAFVSMCLGEEDLQRG